jgi:hypothetical protein
LSRLRTGNTDVPVGHGRDSFTGTPDRIVPALLNYTPEQLRFGTGGPPVAALTMDLATLQVELAGLVFEVAGEREREVFEGRYHRGRDHVVQFVGRKPVDG